MSEPKTILMIDDDQNLVTVSKLYFEAKGYKFLAAHSAGDAIEMLETVRPDVIVLDVIMEDFVAGFRVVSALRVEPPTPALEAQRSTPIIMLTSVTTKTGADLRDRVGTALLPIDKLLEKPVKPSRLEQEIEAVLASRA